MRAYIAGPLFTQSERALLENIDKLCKELQFETYLPHRDAGIFYGSARRSREFFEKDKNVINECDIMIAVISKTVDEGTAWEMGYACSLGKWIILLLEDVRIYEPEMQLNVMIFNSGEIARSLDELRGQLEKIKE